MSGGECLAQSEFAAEVARMLREQGVGVYVDTCGFVSREALDRIIPYTDKFLYDIKAIDGAVHKKCTGRDNSLIIENLKYIDSLGKRIEVRYPYVPHFNSGEAEEIAKLLSSLKNLVGVRILGYHKYAGSKYASLEMENTLPEEMPTDEELEKVKDSFKNLGLNVI